MNLDIAQLLPSAVSALLFTSGFLTFDFSFQIDELSSLKGISISCDLLPTIKLR